VNKDSQDVSLRAGHGEPAEADGAAGSEITILIVDDHALVRRAFRRILEDEPDIHVIGEASDGPEAVEAAYRLRPTVIVMDWSIPKMNGEAATRIIVEKIPEAAVLMVSMHVDSRYVRASLDAGARGYLLKTAMDLDLVNAVRTIAAGGQVIDSCITLLTCESSDAARELTSRELEVLQLIVRGNSNKEVAAVLGLSPNTVAGHRARIMQVLGTRRTAELLLCAVRKGLVNVG
jgi:DNA-binding NarL/FixJ family response regulator